MRWNHDEREKRETDKKEDLRRNGKIGMKLEYNQMCAVALTYSYHHLTHSEIHQCICEHVHKHIPKHLQ